MRSLLLSLCFIFTLLAGFNNISYGADFSYDIDRFTQMGSGVTFVDEFDDDLEPPSGPGGVGDYRVDRPLSPTAESGGLLNLNSDDATTIDRSLSETDVTNVTVASFILPGAGGRVEGKFRFANGINVNTSLGIGIITLNGSPSEDVYFGIGRIPSGKVLAYFDAESNGVDTDISISDITNSVLGSTGVTDATLRLDVSVLNVVTASIDYGSDGIFELIVPGSYALDFHPGADYTGNFYANCYSFLECDLILNPDGSTGVHIAHDNAYGESMPVEWKLWAEIAGSKLPIMNLGSDGTFILPSLLNTTIPLFPSGSLPSGVTIGSRFVDPVTGQEFCVDTITQNEGVDLAGTWNGSYTLSGVPATINTIISQVSTTSFTGTYTTSTGTHGTLTGVTSNPNVSISLTPIGCAGAFNFSGTLNSTNTRIDGTYSGTDCGGTYTGTAALNKL